MFMQHRDTPPGDEYIKDVFANVMPFSRTNPEEVGRNQGVGSRSSNTSRAIDTTRRASGIRDNVSPPSDFELRAFPGRYPRRVGVRQAT